MLTIHLTAGLGYAATSTDDVLRAAVDSCNATQEFAQAQVVFIPLRNTANLCQSSGSLRCNFAVEEAEEMVAALKTARAQYSEFDNLADSLERNGDSATREWLESLRGKILIPSNTENLAFSAYERIAATRCELK
ncbi:MAG: hypothetical protein ACI8RZ_001916 [Myxococcota bacterium]|jgi:hypothetical protein